MIGRERFSRRREHLVQARRVQSAARHLGRLTGTHSGCEIIDA
jgi:hypothetical protein